MIICEFESDAEIVLDLYNPSDFDRPLNCVYGDFIEDMTACSPDEGWGLGYSTGSASLAAITISWAKHLSHFGGVTYSDAQLKEIEFWGTFAEGNQQKLEQDWKFIVNRIDGSATLIFENKRTAYQCNSAERAF